MLCKHIWCDESDDDEQLSKLTHSWKDSSNVSMQRMEGWGEIQIKKPFI